MSENSVERSGNINEDNKQNIPELRFPGFKDEWIELTLNDVSSDGCYGVGAAATEFDGENKYLRITDIDDESHKFVPSPLVSPEGKIEEKYIVKENDLLFARTGASVGKSYLYDNKDGKLVYAGFLIKFNISKANPKFVFYNTCKSKYDNWVRIMSMRSGQPGINLNEYKKYEFKIPSDKEQEKIANFLSAIDKKIELMERKVTLYNNIKKDFFNKLFSEGNNYNIEYDNVKFKNLIKKSKAGGTPKSTIKEYYEGTIPFLSINDMTSQGKYIKSTEKHISEIGLSNSSAWLVPKNSLLYSMYASVGFVSINSIELTTSQAIYSIILKDNISLDYIYYYLSYYKKYVNKYIETGTQGNLNANIVKNLPILIPSTSNQEKIGSFLSVIDKKINLLKQEVKNNKEFKKSLLSKMFC